MEQMKIVQKAMKLFEGSFINRNNELILIPKFNVYFGLNDIQTDEDFYCKMCEWFSRDCSSAMRYKSHLRLARYWEDNTYKFNTLCGTDFDVDDMACIYTVLGNAIKHDLTKEFVKSKFDLQKLMN